MKALITNACVAFLAAACMSSPIVATVCRAQVPGNSDSPGQVQDLSRREALQEITRNQAAEGVAYEAFLNVNEEDPGKKIKLGRDFLGINARGWTYDHPGHFKARRYRFVVTRSHQL
jgi:hypothetical protein